MSRFEHISVVYNHRLSGWVVFLLVGILGPFLAPSTYFLHLEVLVLIYLLLILGMHLLSGLTGQISFGQSAFMGIGAYAGGLALVKAEVPYLAGALIAVASAALVALILGPALVRLLSDYFIIATIALVMVVYLILLNFVSLTGGPLGLSGVPAPSVGGWEISSDVQFYFLMLIIDGIVLLGLINLRKSRMGRALIGIRDDPLAASTFGVRVQYLKTVVLAISAGLAGLSGILFGSFAAYLNPVSCDYTQAVSFAIIIIVGGLGSLPGAVLGTVLVTLSPELLRFLGDGRLVLYGAVLTLLMMFRPQGILGVAPPGQRVRRAWGRKRRVESED